MSIASPLMQPSPNGRRVGIRIVTFEACSDFTRVTARRIAQSPKATFVTRLQPFRLPGRTARQLPDQSTTLWVESSSTGDSRLRGARPTRDMNRPERLWSRRILVYPPVLHDNLEVLGGVGDQVDILQWIAIDQQQIGKGALFHDAELARIRTTLAGQRK
jgi:hypothetical protein